MLAHSVINFFYVVLSEYVTIYFLLATQSSVFKAALIPFLLFIYAYVKGSLGLCCIGP